MKLILPDWIHHENKPIFSIDIHPNGEKFAIGGLGADSGRISIWSINTILNQDKNSSAPRLLCQMDNHLSCVNCVRWNSTGDSLATGSDDKLVMIWKKSASKSGAFGSGGMKQNIENWKCSFTLRGHSGDVLDLAWSPDNRCLATSSVDNSIIIWDALSFPNIISILKGHTGLVKGVTWDPVGKFIASQSDDKTVKIWKTLDWSCQTTINEPFNECGGTTHSLRLSWSPDGQYLVSAHGMNNGAPIAKIIEREGWKCDKDFVGHRKAVTCVRFNRAIFSRGSPGSKIQRYCCLAVGSRDRSLSIWTTNLQRPTIVLNDLFQDSILDISWSSNGCILMACSSDGTVACLQFDKEELGTALTAEEKNQLYQRIYGKDITLDMSQPNKEIIIENSEMLMDTRDEGKSVTQKTPEPPQTPPKFTSTVSSGSQQSPKRTFKQVETRTADGKRRITPMFIPLAEEPVENTESISASISKASTIVDSKSVPLFNLTSSDSGIMSAHEGKLDARIKKVTAPMKMLNPESQYNMEAITTRKETVNERPQLNRIESGNLKPLKGPVIKAVGNLRVQVLNDSLKTPVGSLTKITCNIIISPGNSKRQFEIHIDSPATCFSCCSTYILVCSIDNSIRFIDSTCGTLLLPVMSLSSPVFLCAINQQMAGVLTKHCELRIWNVEEKKVVHSMNCSDIFSRGNATSLFIDDYGTPFITLNDGNSFSYSRSLEAWLKLSATDLMSKTLLSKHISRSFSRNMKACPLTSIQSFGKGTKTNTFEMVSETWPHTMELLFLENQVKLCETLESMDEMKHWYGALGAKLATHGTESHIRKLLDDLLNTYMSNPAGGATPKMYLEMLLNKLKLEPKWQRLYMEYFEQIDI